MLKSKKIIKVCIIFVLILLIIKLISYAVDPMFSMNFKIPASGETGSQTKTVAQYVTLGKKDFYDKMDQLLCLNKDQEIGFSNAYWVKHKIEITGRDARAWGVRKDYKSYNDSNEYDVIDIGSKNNMYQNAYLAGILSSKVERDSSKKNDGGDPIQNAVWYYFKEWMSAVGTKFVDPDGKTINSLKSPQYTGTITDAQKKIAQPVLDEATEYADNFQTSIKLTDKSTNITTKIVGDNYIVGPFTWSFSGKFTAIRAYADNSSTKLENIKIKKYDGSTFTDMRVRDIRSDASFYIAIPKTNGNIKTITKVEAIMSQTQKNVAIWISVLGTGSSYQSLMWYETKETTNDLSKELKYNIPITAIIEIKKVDKDDNTISLNNVGFKIKNNDKNLYVKQSADGTISYVKKEEATEFITTNGKFTIKGLEYGSYTIEETRNPNYGYEIGIGSTVTIEVNKNEISKTITNVKKIGNLKIIKVDKKDNSIKLPNVKFRLKKGEDYIVYDIETKKIKEYTKDENKATIFTTDSNGEIYIENLVGGKYSVIEIENPNYGYEIEVEESETVTIDTGDITKNITNERKYGNLKIIKVDKDDSSIKLANVKFILRKDGKYVVYDNVKKEITEFSDNKNKATVFETDINGEIFIEKVRVGTYEIIETENPNYGYEVEIGENETVDVNSAEIIKTIENEIKVGNLKIIKVDADDISVRLPGVKFILQKEGKYVIYDTGKNEISDFSTDKNKATIFETNSNGELIIENLIIGKYTLIEIENPHYGYELTTQDITVERKQTIEQIVKNKQKYVKLSGYVWEDFIQDNKVSTKNNLFKNDSSDVNDKLLNGITVRLKDTSGNVIQEMQTQKLDIYTENGNDGNGEYRFEDVEKDKLGDYYIEFEYDGLVYTNVSPNINLNNGSKSIENTLIRENFNKGFSTVRGRSNQSSSIGVGYTTDSPNSDQGNKVYDLTYKLSNHTATLENDGKTFNIVANTADAQYDLSKNHKAGQEEIKYINLGIYKRSQPQLVLRKEIENVKLGINDFEHTYVYENRFDNQEIKTEFQQSGYGVKFGEKYLNTKYSLPVYNSDYTTELANKTKELKVYITYKIEIVNQSGDLYSQVNSIVDYYDDQCTIVKAGTTLDNTGNIGNVLQTKNVTDKNFNGYNSTRILTQSKIEPNKSQEIYIQFELSREKVKDIIEYNESNISQKELVDNVAEIYEYSTYDENGKIYAGIDKSSNPANTEPGNTDSFELDTDRAPGLLLEDGGDRQIAGIVFEDSNGTENVLKTGETRQGNGYYENNEPKIKDVTVTLKDKDGTERGTATTNENGEYTISKFIPGEYNIVFSWGNGDKYIVEDYKGTVYDKERYDNNTKNPYWYKTDKEKQTRYSDALDDYTIRQGIPTDWIKPSGTIMNSTTPNFKVDIETDTSVGSGTYEIENMDFGIIEMARQAVEIHKNVSALKITLANGQTIIDATIKDGQIEQSIPELTLVDKTLKAEIESELIQGAQLNLKYDISIDNKSEVDYITKDYYLFGKDGTENDIAKINIEKIYDYIDGEFMLNSQENSDWAEKSATDYNTENELTIQELWNKEYIITDNSITKNESVDYNQLNDWKNEAKTSRKEYFKDKAILVTNSFQGELKPGTSTGVVSLISSKLLGGNDEVDLNNEVEITKIVKDSTRKITPFESVVKAKAESTTVTPPTGENRSYIIPVIISISVLIVLGAGIILIKKKII